MNKLQMNFIAGLALLGLENKAQDVLTKEFKAQLTTLEKAQEAVEKIEETVEVYNTLSADMKAQKKALEDEVNELRLSIIKLDIKSDLVAQVMEINKQIDAKEVQIKAVASAQLALGQKAKADTMDALAEGYKVVNALAAEIRQLIDTVKPVVSKSNKSQIVQALQTVIHEMNGYSYVLRDVSNSINADRATHNGVRFYFSDLSIISAMADLERM
ncbi:hypothetical protein HMPREF1013_04856 [Bacillus sp. 2_A_57_CT2]|nr:hypothetical protein HMPREF1013_04856 [Bacillus sp. 2_A_57_CT2]